MRMATFSPTLARAAARECHKPNVPTGKRMSLGMISRLRRSTAKAAGRLQPSSRDTQEQA